MASPASPVFIPLHVRSHYSIVDGLSGVEDIVACAAHLGYPALALTDFNNVSGFIRFYDACRKAGIKPLLGCDLQVRESLGGDRALLTVLAQDRTGKSNLFKLLSHAWLDVGSPDPQDAACTLEDLRKHAEGIIVLSGFRSDIGRLLVRGATREAEERLKHYLEIFGDRFFFEICRTGRHGEDVFECAALELCLKYGIAPVASNDTRFMHGAEPGTAAELTDYNVHDVRVAIQTNELRGSARLAELYSPEQYLKSPAQMSELFADLPETLENTCLLAARCNIADNRIFELDKPRLPHFDTGSLKTGEALAQKARAGLKERLAFLYPDEAEREKQRPRYEQRLEYELGVIVKMDFPGYFLIVQDFIVWSKEHGVPVGPGRGSGGGSLVAYALRITDFDPLRFNLLFERFLNPERISMPDFDIDFCQAKRSLVIDYVRERYDALSLKRYQEISVAQIVAFGTLKARAAIHAVGRVIGLPLAHCNRIAKAIPNKPDMTFAIALGEKGDSGEGPTDLALQVQQARASDDRLTLQLIAIARRLEGVSHSIGKHAAGVVISPTRMSDFAPLMLDSEGKPITQFDKKDIEHAGLVKFDFLGLATLTIIDQALAMINARLKRSGARAPLTVEQIPYADDACFKMLCTGQTTAVFQLESEGMRRLIMQLQPDRLEDLVALVALYRPGPLESGMAESFVKRKRGQEKISYPQPDCEEAVLHDCLEPTYGVIVYQEQVMQIAQVLAGYSLGAADILRRAMGKKDNKLMEENMDRFCKGAAARGHDPKRARLLFASVRQFAKYGFNQSHSAAYALLAWWTLWLKVHYPVEFLAAMMTNDAKKPEKLITYIAECRRLGGKVNPPDINSGSFEFTVNEKGEVVYGFAALKGVGEELVRGFCKDRERNGPFLDMFDFTARVTLINEAQHLLTRKSLECLIMAGAFDSLGASRATLMANRETALKYAQSYAQDTHSGQLDMFGGAGAALARPQLKEVPDWPLRQRLALEYEVLGLYLSGHPIEPYREEIAYFCGPGTLAALRPGGPDVRLGALALNPVRRPARNGGYRYSVILDDGTTSGLEIGLYDRDAEVFEQIWNAYQQRCNGTHGKSSKTQERQFHPPLVLIVEAGFRQSRDGEHTRLFVNRIDTLEQVRLQHATHLCFRFPADELRARGTELITLLQRHRAPDPREPGCTFSIRSGNTELCLAPTPRSRYRASDALLEGLRDLGGPDCLHLHYGA